MKSLILKLNPSLKVKFLLLNQHHQELWRGNDRSFPDFWNTFLGWIVSLPNTYCFNNGLEMKRRFSSMKIIFGGKTDRHHFSAIINNPSLSRGGKKRPSRVIIDDHDYSIYRVQRGNYFSLYDQDQKVFAMKKDHQYRDNFLSVFNDQLIDEQLAAMIMVALADSI